MNRMTPLAIVLAAAFALFYLSAATPRPKSAAAPGTAFSAARAMLDDAALAAVPHPVGSAANAKVRDRLFARMAALGLAPRLLPAEARESRDVGGETWISGGDIEDVIGVLAGRDRRLPALLLMAHYDSVAGSPGAADDIAGVSSILEIVRALQARGQPERDVIIAFTDGEEAGLLGARAFFTLDPLARRIGFVANFEARGGGGRAAMFETGAANGKVIDLYRRTADHPDSNSLAVFVYKLLPNDTDFSIAKARGLPGLNYAFIGRQFDYHSPSSTIDALDQGSVQHMGEEALGTVASLAFSRALPPRAPNQVYSDVLGLFVVAYPMWGGWVALVIATALLAIALARAAARGRLSARGVMAGAAMSLLVLFGAFLALAAIRLVTGVGFGLLAARPLLARFTWFEAASALAALAAVVGAAAMFAGRERRLPGLWAGLLLTGLLLAVVAQVVAPLTAFVVAWPLLAAGLAAAATALERPRSPAMWFVVGGAAILATSWLLGVGHSFLQGLDIAGAAAPVALIAAFTLLPLAWPGAERQAGLALAGVMVLAALGVGLWLRFSAPWTPRHPQASELLYVVDTAASRAWRADAAGSPTGESAWARAVLTGDGGKLQPLLLPGSSTPVASAPARFVDAADPSIQATRASSGRVTVTVRPSGGYARLRIDLRLDAVAIDPRINGLPAPVFLHPGRWTHLRWEAAPEGLVISFTPASPASLDLEWAQFTPGWPAMARPLPARPAAVMGWDLAGSTVVVGRSHVRF